MLYLYSQSYLELVKFNIFWYFYFNTFKLHIFKGKPKVNIQFSYPINFAKFINAAEEYTSLLVVLH